jgi:hypothetical protein
MVASLQEEELDFQDLVVHGDDYNNSDAARASLVDTFHGRDGDEEDRVVAVLVQLHSF